MYHSQPDDAANNELKKEKPMEELFKTGQVLSRSAMKKVKAGSGECRNECKRIWQACAAATVRNASGRKVCQEQAGNCYGMCHPEGSWSRYFYIEAL